MHYENMKLGKAIFSLIIAVPVHYYCAFNKFSVISTNQIHIVVEFQDIYMVYQVNQEDLWYNTIIHMWPDMGKSATLSRIK